MKIKFITVGKNKIAVIKLMRDLTTLSLQICKEITESKNGSFIIPIPRLAPEEIIKQFAETGSVIEVEMLEEDNETQTERILMDQKPIRKQYEITLLSVGRNKLEIIKLLREVTGGGLAACKEMVDKLPSKLPIPIEEFDLPKVSKAFKSLDCQIEVKEIDLFAQRIIEESERREKPISFTVTILNSSSNKLEAIKLIRTLSYIGLADAKAIIENTPSKFVSTNPEFTARQIVEKFNVLAIHVEIDDYQYDTKQEIPKTPPKKLDGKPQSVENPLEKKKENEEQNEKNNDYNSIFQSELVEVQQPIKTIKVEEKEKKKTDSYNTNFNFDTSNQQPENRLRAIFAGFSSATLLGSSFHLHIKENIAYYAEIVTIIIAIAVALSMKKFGKVVQKKYRFFAIAFTLYGNFLGYFFTQKESIPETLRIFFTFNNILVLTFASVLAYMLSVEKPKYSSDL